LAREILARKSILTEKSQTNERDAFFEWGFRVEYTYIYIYTPYDNNDTRQRENDFRQKHRVGGHEHVSDKQSEIAGPFIIDRNVFHVTQAHCIVFK